MVVTDSLELVDPKIIQQLAEGKTVIVLSSFVGEYKRKKRKLSLVSEFNTRSEAVRVLNLTKNIPWDDQENFLYILPYEGE